MRLTMSFVCAVLITAAFSLTALAQQAPGDGADPGIRPAPRQQMTPEKFNAVKTRMLQVIEQRRQRLEQEKACVEAATTPAELRKCRPARPRGMGPDNRGQRGPGQQMPLQSPAGQPQ